MFIFSHNSTYFFREFYIINNSLSSFQAGVDSIYSACTSYGSTPSAKTPAAIKTSIANIYTNRYNSGYNAGYSNGQSNGYNNNTGLGVTCIYYKGSRSAQAYLPAGTYYIWALYVCLNGRTASVSVFNVTANTSIYSFTSSNSQEGAYAISSSFTLSSPAIIRVTATATSTNVTISSASISVVKA